MNKAQLYITLLLIPILFCCFQNKLNTEPTKFDKINNLDIKAKYRLMTTNVITAKDSTGILVKAGEIMVFKTNNDSFGKLEVVSINALNNTLTLNVVLYNGDGSIKSTENNVTIHSSLGCDLDIPSEGNVGLKSDIKWNIYGTNNVNASIDPINGTLFFKYTL
jgi:hypothetical protein